MLNKIGVDVALLVGSKRFGYMLWNFKHRCANDTDTGIIIHMKPKALRFVIPLDELRQEELSVMVDQLYSVRGLTDLLYRTEIEAMILEKEQEVRPARFEKKKR